MNMEPSGDTIIINYQFIFTKFETSVNNNLG